MWFRGMNLMSDQFGWWTHKSRSDEWVLQSNWSRVRFRTLNHTFIGFYLYLMTSRPILLVLFSHFDCDDATFWRQNEAPTIVTSQWLLLHHNGVMTSQFEIIYANCVDHTVWITTMILIVWSTWFFYSVHTKSWDIKINVIICLGSSYCYIFFLFLFNSMPLCPLQK